VAPTAFTTQSVEADVVLETVNFQPGYFRPSKTTSQENSNHRVVPFAAQAALVEDGKEALALCRR
jgi:hypothetical protein